MAFQPGQSGNPNGRKPGSVNNATKEIREAFAALLHGRESELHAALDQLKEKDPRAYLEMYLKISNKFVPDISRSEISGVDGEPIQPIQIVLPQKPGSDA